MSKHVAGKQAAVAAFRNLISNQRLGNREPRFPRVGGARFLYGDGEEGKELNLWHGIGEALLIHKGYPIVVRREQI